MNNSKKYRRQSRSRKSRKSPKSSGKRRSRRRSKSSSRQSKTIKTQSRESLRKQYSTNTTKKISHKRTDEEKPVRNQFNMIQIKKMIGKKLLIPWKWIAITDKIKKQSQDVQKRLISLAKEKNYKTIVMTTTSINGVFIVIKGLERYMAINSTSYKTIKNYDMQNFRITLVCYPKLTQSKIKSMLS